MNDLKEAVSSIIALRLQKKIVITKKKNNRSFIYAP